MLPTGAKRKLADGVLKKRSNYSVGGATLMGRVGVLDESTEAELVGCIVLLFFRKCCYANGSLEGDGDQPGVIDGRAVLGIW